MTHLQFLCCLGKWESDCFAPGIFRHLAGRLGNIPFVIAENSAFTIAERLLLPAFLARLTGTSLASAVVDQFIADLDELVDAVGTRVGSNKAAIMNKEARVVAGLTQRAARSCHAA